MENDKVLLTEIGITHGKDHGAPVPANAKYENPVDWNPGFEQAMTYIQYASPELSNDKTAQYKEIVGKNAVQIINGSLSAADGVAAMNNELKQAGVIN